MQRERRRAPDLQARGGNPDPCHLRLGLDDALGDAGDALDRDLDAHDEHDEQRGFAVRHFGTGACVATIVVGYGGIRDVLRL